MDNIDEKYMQTALKLARRGIGRVEPNPTVGCIIVKADQIIAKGWHKKFGSPHAEINALEDCKKLGARSNGATMYVTLEPCCHHGKTPPCTDAIIAAKLAKVFIATADPSEHAKGKGVEQLRKAGIEVKLGVCEQQAYFLNAPFFKFTSTGKPWIILKWAQSIDGKMACTNKKWISGEQSRQDVHKLRRRSDAILVGINTVLADNPLLTARPAKGKKLLRIVLDNHLRIPLNCKLLQTAKKQPLLITAWKDAADKNSQIAKAIIKKGAQIITYPDTPSRSNLYFVLNELAKRGITQLLVEGGPAVITSFLKEKLADEVCVYIAPEILASKGSADITGLINELPQSLTLNYVDIKRFGDDVRMTGLVKNSPNKSHRE